MKKILVTGAGGYIGTRLVPALLARGWAVRAVDRFFFGEELLAEHEHLEKVREDTRRLTDWHLDGIDAVIDLVAISNEACGQLFSDATWQINCESRVRTARLAKEAGASIYLLPSSCSVYGVQDRAAVCDEQAQPNPQTAYGKANLQAERRTIELADDDFTVVVLRQATIFGLSPRIRLDLAINFMVQRAHQTGLVPVVRDGTQWRPFLHIDDAVDAQLFMIERAERSAINGQVFNVGADELNYTSEDLGKLVAESIPKPVELEWIGDADQRSYHIDCRKVESLGWRATRRIPETVRELWDRFEAGQIPDGPPSHTLKWYRELEHWRQIIDRVQMYGGILDIERDREE